MPERPAVPPPPNLGARPGVEVEVAPMRRRHLRQVVRIEGRTSTTPWSLGLFLAELGRDQRAYLVAQHERRVVGFAGALLVAGEAHVTTVAVDPDHQGHGIGSRVLLALVRRCIHLGARAVTLEVRVSNTAALALYRRFGFAPAGVRKGYYSRPTEDALVLWAHAVAEAGYQQRLATIGAELAPLVVRDEASPGPLDDDVGHTADTDETDDRD